MSKLNNKESQGKDKYYSYELRPVLLNILSLVLLVFMIFSLTVIFKLNFDMEIGPFDIVLYLFWFILHEILHGIGFGIFKNTEWKYITFGMLLEKGIFYCMCKQEISKKNILVAIAFPFFFIGVVTLIISIYTNSFILFSLSILNIAGAIGDIIMFMAIVTMPKDVRYIDTDDQMSFTMISKEKLKNKYFGIKLKETGIYNYEKMKSKDLKKINISKLSLIFLIFILVCTLINVLGFIL
jgi:Protein of unknown function (DUF3267).